MKAKRGALTVGLWGAMTVFVASLLGAGSQQCSVVPGTPTATAVSTASPTAEWTVTMTPLPTWTPTTTQEPTSTPGPTWTATATATPSAATPTEQPTITPEPTWVFEGKRFLADDTTLEINQGSAVLAFSPLLTVGWGQTNAALIRFDTSSIPARAMILSATLELYAAGWAGEPLDVGVHIVLRANDVWTATWGQAAAGVPWGIGGCNGTTDRLPLAMIEQRLNGPRTWYRFDWTPAMQVWHDGQMANNGLLVRAMTDAQTGFLFESAETTAGHAPALAVDYAVPLVEVVHGLATHYDPEEHAGRETRSGEMYDALAMTGAVAAERWKELKHQCLRVVAVDSGRAVTVRINDSGWLTEAGRFAWQMHRIGEFDVAQYWPDARGLPVVLDLPPGPFSLLSPDMETVEVRGYVVECEWAANLAGSVEE